MLYRIFIEIFKRFCGYCAFLYICITGHINTLSSNKQVYQKLYVCIYFLNNKPLSLSTVNVTEQLQETIYLSRCQKRYGVLFYLTYPCFERFL